MNPNRVTISEIILHGAVLLAVLAVLFPPVFLRGEMSLPGGTLLQGPPWNQYQEAPPPKNWLTQETLLQGAMWYRLTAEMLEDGEWPLWNPLQLGGMPLLGNSQSTVLYPPRLIHLATDPYVGTTIVLLLKLWLCGFTAYLLGRGIGLRRAPSQFLSLGWMLCAYNQHWAYWPPVDVSVWVPIALLGVEWILARRYQKGFFALAFGATLLLLAGHPETAFGQGFGMGVYFSLRLIIERRFYDRIWRPVAVAGAAWGAALIVSAAAVLPLLEYLPVSEQFVGRPEAEAAFEFAPPLAYISFFIPRFFGSVPEGNYWGSTSANFANTFYLGIAVWVGLGLLFTPPSGRARRNRAVCLAATALFCTLLAFPLPVMRWIQELPVLDSMWPYYFLPFALLAILVLGASGIQQWFDRERKSRELRGPAVVLAAVSAIALGTFLFQFETLITHEVFLYVVFQIAVAAGIAILCLLVLHAAVKYPKVCRAAPYLLVLILAVDLLHAARGLRPTSPREHLFFETELTNYLTELPEPSRVRVGPSGIMPGLLQHYGIEQWNAYDGIMPYRTRRFFLRTYGTGVWQRIYRIAAIDHYLFRLDIEDHPERYAHLEHVGIIDGIEVMRDPEALPRAFLTGRLRPVDGEEGMFAALAQSDFDPLREVLTDAPPPPPWPEDDADVPGTAQVRSYAPRRVVVDAETRGDCVLVLADCFFPGWRARVNGVEVPIFPAYFAFRGVVLPVGVHTVEFTYEPAAFRWGLRISVIALFLGAIGAVWCIWRDVRPRWHGQHAAPD